jgi:25S rRNA (uracil2634-N3)-methyltransferase
MPTEFPSPYEIDRLIGSSAYRDAGHPQSASTRYAVTNWFAARYGADSSIDKKPLARGDHGDVQDARQNYIICRALAGNTLVVGEGNFSFTASLVFDHHVTPMSITSTIHENSRDISDDTKAIAQKLSRVGVTILHDVDATHLEKTFSHQQFDTIIFQFPNAGSREPNRGHNPNYVLVRLFLKSAVEHLRKNGEIIVTVVNSSYYYGRFRMDEAAKYAGIKDFYAIPFNQGDFPSYSHVNTNDENSALKEYRSFETWIFQP